MSTRHRVLTSVTIIFAVFCMVSMSSAKNLKKPHSIFRDKSVCYAFAPNAEPPVDPAQIVRLNIKKHSRLTEPQEEQKFNHPRQTTYSAQGKWIAKDSDSGEITLASVTGQVLVADGVPPGENATRLALTIFNLLSAGNILGVGQFGAYHLECGSETSSASPGAYTSCRWRTPNGSVFVSIGFEVLGRIDPLENDLCSQFPDVSF